MKKPNRISMSLFDDELKSLINASAKIFPITQLDVDTNSNPNEYEYGRVGNSIYRWNNSKWEYIIADDKDISWLDVKDKPTLYQPSEHTHLEIDINNLDKYTKLETDTKFVNKTELDSHASDSIKHITVEEKTLLSTISNKSDKIYVDVELAKKSDSTHNHDGSYYKKTEVDSKLSYKSDSTHTHNYSPSTHLHDERYAVKSIEPTVEDISLRMYNIENGYTEGHKHPDIALLNNITPEDVVAWDGIKTHVIDSNKHVSESERILWNTVNNKSPNTHLHDERYATVTHNHSDTYYTKLETDASLATKSNTSHIHDDKYYTELEIDAKLASKTDKSTFDGHTGNTIVHVTQVNKNTWDSKSKIVIGTIQPIDNSIWLEEV